MNKLFFMLVLLLGLNLYALDNHQINRLSKTFYIPDNKIDGGQTQRRAEQIARDSTNNKNIINVDQR